LCGLGLAELADGSMRMFNHLPGSGAHGKDLVCACARASADGDVNRHVIEALGYY